MTTPHPHADLLRAIADGKQIQIKRSSEWLNCAAAAARAMITPLKGGAE